MSSDKKINNNFNWDRLVFILKLLVLQPFIEVYYGLETKKLPLIPCLYFTLVFQVFAVFHIDLWGFAKLDITWLYPTGKTLRIYQVLGSIWSFYCWGVFQSCLQVKLVRRLTQVFTDLKLKSITGRMPSFIFDSPLDDYARTMRLRRNGFTKLQFEAVQDRLESDLQIYIDEIKEDRTKGTIDIIYSQKSLSKLYEMPAIDFFSKGKFLIGQTRLKTLSYNFREIPHLLVAGQTGGGKSSFLRQFIATLYLKNTNYTFDLIDLKFSEFHVFKKLPRITVIEDVPTSIDKICEISEVMMERRKKLLSINECVDLDQFLKIPKAERKYPKGLSKKSNLSKHIVIIDEAIDLFLTGTTSTAQAKRAKHSAARIAAQGRVVGIHLVVATQRPDRHAVDPKIKANLVGRLCFRMANIASSMTVLDSKRATEIPEDIKGRAIWAGAKGQLEVQTPYLSIEGADELLSHLRESPLELKKEKNTEEEIKVPVAELNS